MSFSMLNVLGKLKPKKKSSAPQQSGGYVPAPGSGPGMLDSLPPRTEAPGSGPDSTSPYLIANEGVQAGLGGFDLSRNTPVGEPPGSESDSPYTLTDYTVQRGGPPGGESDSPYTLTDYTEQRGGPPGGDSDSPYTLTDYTEQRGGPPGGDSDSPYTLTDYTEQRGGPPGGESDSPYTLTDYREALGGETGDTDAVEMQPLELTEQDLIEAENEEAQELGLVPELPERELDPHLVADDKRSRWHEDVKQRTTLPTVSLHSDYRGEMFNQHRPGTLSTEINKKEMLGTYYASGPEEYGTQFVDGTLQKGGKTLDSTGNKRIYAKDKNGRSNFALNGAGDLFTSDVRTETDKYASTDTGYRHNHSSLVGGGDLTSAGTMEVHDGKVQTLSDDSGHYRPDMTQTFAGVKHLMSKGVMAPKSGVELSGKSPGQKPFRARTEDFMRYEGMVNQARERSSKTQSPTPLERPEQALRKELGARYSLMSELGSTGFKRKAERISGRSSQRNGIRSLEQTRNERMRETLQGWSWDGERGRGVDPGESSSDLQSNEGEVPPRFSDLQSNEGEVPPRFSDLQSNEGEVPPRFSDLQSNEGEVPPRFSDLQSNEGEVPPRFSDLDGSGEVNGEFSGDELESDGDDVNPYLLDKYGVDPEAVNRYLDTNN